MKKKLTIATFIITLLICCSCSTAFTQKRIGGKVTSQDGDELAGVNIFVKATRIATVSDKNGMYQIDVPTGSNVLSFSYVGYVTTDETIDDRTVMNVCYRKTVRFQALLS